jgi:hypothetical protein
LREAITNSARGSVVALSVTRGKDQDFFHESRGARKFNGYLDAAK